MIRKLLLQTFAALVVAAVCSGAADAQPLESWTRMIEQGEASTKGVQALLTHRLRGGYGDDALLGSSFLDAAESEPRQAQKLSWLLLAAEAAPGDPRCHAALFTHYMTYSQFGEALYALIDVIRATVVDPWIQANWLIKGVIVVCLAGSLTMLLFLAIFFVTKYSEAMHDYRDSFPVNFRRFTPRVFPIFIGCMLVAVGGGPLILLCLPWLLVLPFVNNRGKAILGIGMAFAFLLFPAIGLQSGLNGNTGDPAWTYYNVYRGAAGQETVEEFVRTFPEKSIKRDFTLARLARRNGDYAGAVSILVDLSGKGYDELIRMEHGNNLYLLGRYLEAISQYEQAANGEASWKPWYNMHLAYLGALNFTDSDKALARARSIGGSAVDSYMTGSGENTGLSLPVSIELPAQWVRMEIAGSLGEKSWGELLWRGLFAPHEYANPFIAAGLALLLTIMACLTKREKYSALCPSCGEMLCPRCHPKPKESRLCSACYSLRHARDLDETAKKNLRRKIADWETRVKRYKRIGRVVLPGWSGFVFEQKLSGLFVGLIWSLCVSSILALAVYPAPVIPVWSDILFYVVVAVAGFCHLTGFFGKPVKA